MLLTESRKSAPELLLSQCRPITCIEVTRDYIIICEGPGLVILDKNRKVISRKVIFPLHKTILGISVTQINSDLLYIFAFGRYYSQLYHFNVLSLEIKQSIFFECAEALSCINNEVTYLAATWLNNGLYLAAITDENVVHLWNLGCDELTSGRSLQEQPIICSKVRGVQTSLFSATLAGQTHEKLIVFSGTNLSSILVWAPQDSRANHHVLLEGLKGSVLSLKFCYENQILVASTDQRSVFAWKFSSEVGSSFGPDVLERKKVAIHLIGEFTGHTGRVWQVDICGRNIVSTGQDANIFLWDTMGNLLKVWSKSTSVSVRCCRLDAWENSVISGADDGSAYLWDFSGQRSIDKTIDLIDRSSDGLKVSNVDYPRQVTCYSVNHFIVSMNSGKLLLVDIEGNKFEIFSHSQLSSYNIFAVSPDRSNLVIGSINGVLYFVNIQGLLTGDTEYKTTRQHYQLMNFESKIVSLHWVTLDRLVLSTCNHVYILENRQGEPENEKWYQSCQFNMNCKDKPGVSAAINIVVNQEIYLILGDEVGNVHLYKLGQETTYPLFSLYKLHGSYGVCNFKLGLHKDEIFSVGRNTSIMNLKVEIEPNVRITIIQVIGSSLNWNSRLITTKKGSYICGFSENDFVIIDETEGKIAKHVFCGGAHRFWDVAFGDVVSFVFVRHKQLKLSQFALDSTTLKPGFYGGKTINTIVACPYLPDVNSKNFCILTGGEDGILRLSVIRLAGNQLNELSICKLSKFKGHVSSIRTINYHHLVEKSSLLIFSGGGRSQLVASIIEYRGDNDAAWSKKSTIQLQNKQLKDSNPDMRIMNICKSGMKQDNVLCQFLLLCACSDGFLYLVTFDMSTSKFFHLKTFHTSRPEFELSHSISSVSFLTNVIYCSNSIGKVIMYSTNGSKMDSNNPINLDKYRLYKYQTNASAITAMKIISLPELGNVLVTGSDDGVLKLTLVVQVPRIDNVEQFAFVPIHEDRKHHSSAINSICVCQNRIFAASADQVVSFRRIDGQDEGMMRCGVSDVQAMSVLPYPCSQNSVLVLLGGQGFEILKVNVCKYT